MRIGCATVALVEERYPAGPTLGGVFLCPPSPHRSTLRSMNPVVHFEMPYEDRDRMAKFYEDAFAWKTQKLGPDMGNYVLVTTTEKVVKPDAPRGAINGGF